MERGQDRWGRRGEVIWWLRQMSTSMVTNQGTSKIASVSRSQEWSMEQNLQYSLQKEHSSADTLTSGFQHASVSINFCCFCGCKLQQPHDTHTAFKGGHWKGTYICSSHVHERAVAGDKNRCRCKSWGGDRTGGARGQCRVEQTELWSTRAKVHRAEVSICS